MAGRDHGRTDPSPAGEVALEIRILGVGDETILHHVADGVFDEALDASLVAEFLRDPRHHLVVAVEDREVIAFVSGVHYVHPDKPAQMFINEVGVAPSHQGRGIGKAIVEAMLQHARRLDCSEAWVLTDRGNEAAMRLYASAGGEEASPDSVMFTFYFNRDGREREK
jgi:ribosomal protein S18 acetylase RimI-like enzyme